jgi:lysophospholipase L1-like esterase
MNIKNLVVSVVLFLAATMLGLGALEAALRIKNSSMKNYDIEMWRYANALKVRSQNPALGHVHLKNKSALLQSVDIRTNEWGLRGPPLAEAGESARRILFLGGSITLGWGVPEEDTVSVRVEKGLRARGESVEVLNGGIGNYNAQRYVERFLVELKDLNPTDIVVQYFLRDAEDLDPGRDNWLLHNSELAVTSWIAVSRLIGKTGEASLLDHYREAYREDGVGYRNMRSALQQLADFAKANNIRIYLAMTPDVHNLKDYQFGFVHERMKRVAAELGYTYVDLLGAFGTLSPEEVWAMPGDPHPNALGHKLMADAIIPAVTIGK